MAEEENPVSLLNLVMEKGPRSGESLEFLPSDPPIRVGRVVRGNSVPIKDPGISTKHLTIHFKSPHWLITDLGSSNGTVLNSSPLPSLSPTVLRHGDLVKIGEVTLVRVGIVGVDVGRKENVDVESGFGGELGNKPPRGRTRRQKVAEENVGLITESGFGEEMGKKAVGVEKRGRGRPKKEKGEIFFENVGRNTRGSKNMTGNSSVDEEVGVVAEVFEKKTRGRRGKEKVPDSGPQVCTRRTRSVKVVENAEKEDVDAHIASVKMTDKGKKRNNNEGKLGLVEGNCSEKGNVIDVQSGDGLNSESVVVKIEPRDSFCEVENLGTDKEERARGGNSVRESGSKSLEAPDLAKMTLRDYFDYLEVSLPKQIIDETELIIAEMHKKAEMYKEFVCEHKKGKGTSK